jgi:hypothetical protein
MQIIPRQGGLHVIPLPAINCTATPQLHAVLFHPVRDGPGGRIDKHCPYRIALPHRIPRRKHGLDLLSSNRLTQVGADLIYHLGCNGHCIAGLGH